jgi:hypothetical protein
MIILQHLRRYFVYKVSINSFNILKSIAHWGKGFTLTKKTVCRIIHKGYEPRNPMLSRHNLTYHLTQVINNWFDNWRLKHLNLNLYDTVISQDD